MKENNVSELDLEQNGSRLSLRRATTETREVVSVAPVAPVAKTSAAPAPTAPEKAEPRAKAQPESDSYKTINSPMVGTFYAAPSPEAPPFVKPGDVVSPEKTVCIIEAMKIFNDIPADISGTIVETLVKSGDPVEFGTPLFKIDAR